MPARAQEHSDETNAGEQTSILGGETDFLSNRSEYEGERSKIDRVEEPRRRYDRKDAMLIGGQRQSLQPGDDAVSGILGISRRLADVLRLHRVTPFASTMA